MLNTCQKPETSGRSQSCSAPSRIGAFGPRSGRAGMGPARCQEPPGGDQTKDPLCPEAHSSCGGAERGSEESDTGLHQTDGVVFCFAMFFSIQRDILQGQEFKAGRKSLAESHTATAVKGWSPETLHPTPGAPFAWQKATSYRNITLLLFAMGFNLYKHMKSPPAAYIVAGFAETQHFLSHSSFEENRSLIA